MSRVKEQMPYRRTTRLGKGNTFREVAAGSRARTEKFGIDRTITAKMELGDPNIVEMLGDEPTYIHSHERNFELGLLTVWGDLERVYNQIRQQSITRAQKIKAILLKQEKELVDYVNTQIGTTYTINGIIDLFNKSDANFGDTGLRELYNQLNYLKEWMTLLPLGKQDPNWNALYQQDKIGIRYQLNEGFAKVRELAEKLLKIDNTQLSDVARQQVKWMADRLGERLDTSKSPVGMMQMSIGKTLEVLDEDIVKQLGDTLVQYKVLNAAQESSSGKGVKYVDRSGTAAQKIDNVIEVDNTIRLFTTDKTGRIARANGKQPSLEIGRFTEKTFTACSSAANILNSSRQVVEQNLEELGGDTKILKYVTANSTYFAGLPLAKRARVMIAAMYYWNRIFVEILGADGLNQYPALIRNFGEYFRVVDLIDYIIKQGQNSDGSEVENRNIVTGASSFINRSRALPKKLYNEKGKAIRRIVRSFDQTLNYETLKKEIEPNLPKKINQSISLKFNIGLNNIRRLK